jgi:hypothetical protein
MTLLTIAIWGVMTLLALGWIGFASRAVPDGMDRRTA